MYNHLLGIVGHEARAPQIAKLSADVNPDCVMVDEVDGVGPTENHLAVLRWMNKHGARMSNDWAVVLEDDAICADNFRAEVDVCLDYAPTDIVSLYLGTGYPAQYQRKFAEAAATDVSWIIHPWLRHAVAYAVNVDILPGLIETMTELSRQRWAPDDTISAFALRRGPVAYSNPSLVDHNDSLPPVIRQRTHLGMPTFGRKRPRRAHNFSMPICWNDSSVTL